MLATLEFHTLLQ